MMTKFKQRLEELRIQNFQVNKLKDSLDKIEELSHKLAEHTILLLIYPNDDSVIHWRIELLAWLEKIKTYNKVKTKSGKLEIGQLYYRMYGIPLGEYTDIEITLRSAISHYLDIQSMRLGKINKLAPNKVDISKYDLDNFMISLGAIYDDYVNYVSNNMTESELESRIVKYYLYED